MVKREKRTIELKEFRIDKLRPNSKIALIGPPGTGKSSVIDSILWYFAHFFPVAKVFSGTEDTNHFYEGPEPKKSKIPAYYIWEELDEDEIKRFLKRQRILTHKSKTDPSINPWGMLICDDVSDDRKMLNKKVFQTIMKMSRHHSLLFALVMQYACDCSASMRSAFDYIFIMQTTDLKSLENIHTNFASDIRDYKDFVDIMKQVAKNFAALVIDRTNRDSNKLEDRVYYYQPPFPIPTFQFGCKEYRRKHDLEYNYEYDPVDDLLDEEDEKPKRKRR